MTPHPDNRQRFREQRPVAAPRQSPMSRVVPPQKRDQRPRPAGESGASRATPSKVAPKVTSKITPEVSGLMSASQAVAPDQSSAKSSGDKGRRRLGTTLGKHWHILSLGALAIVGGVGVFSAISLFRIPNLPNCRAIFWPAASATTRVQCAEAYADQGTLDGYSDAIALVDRLPETHPLRSNINQRIETWAEQILLLAEETFQAGKPDQAVSIARRIPQRTTAARLSSQKIGSWKSIWEEAEAIYGSAEEDLKNRNFRDAFAKAVLLLEVGNRHWETTKYEELTGLISTARWELNELGRARRLIQQNRLESTLEAVGIALAIQPESPLYSEAQTLIGEFGHSLLDLADQALRDRNAALAQDILNRIPPEARLAEDVMDYRTIVQASELSWQGGITGLEGGIVRLQSISRDRPQYARARDLIGLWRQEAQGRSQLDWARLIANPGTVADLKAAIAEAQEVTRDNPVWSDAQDQIDRWRTQVETIEDQPYLRQAELLAQQGDLESAIANARMIRPGRALHAVAQDRINDWVSQIQQVEDGPILTQAQRLADRGQLQEAILVASQIGSNRALFADAQSDIGRWRSLLDGQLQLQQAYHLAQIGTVSSLVEAIELALQISEDSLQRADAIAAADGWSWDILKIAEADVPYNLERGIQIAAQVPPRTEAYALAQRRLREWRELVQPPAGAGEGLY